MKKSQFLKSLSFCTSLLFLVGQMFVPVASTAVSIFEDEVNPIFQSSQGSVDINNQTLGKKRGDTNSGDENLDQNTVPKTLFEADGGETQSTGASVDGNPFDQSRNANNALGIESSTMTDRRLVGSEIDKVFKSALNEKDEDFSVLWNEEIAEKNPEEMWEIFQDLLTVTDGRLDLLEVRTGLKDSLLQFQQVYEKADIKLHESMNDLNWIYQMNDGRWVMAENGSIEVDRVSALDLYDAQSGFGDLSALYEEYKDKAYMEYHPLTKFGKPWALGNSMEIMQELDPVVFEHIRCLENSDGCDETDLPTMLELDLYQNDPRSINQVNFQETYGAKAGSDAYKTQAWVDLIQAFGALLDQTGNLPEKEDVVIETNETAEQILGLIQNATDDTYVKKGVLDYFRTMIEASDELLPAIENFWTNGMGTQEDLNSGAYDYEIPPGSWYDSVTNRNNRDLEILLHPDARYCTDAAGNSVPCYLTQGCHYTADRSTHVFPFICGLGLGEMFQSWDNYNSKYQDMQENAQQVVDYPHNYYGPEAYDQLSRWWDPDNPFAETYWMNKMSETVNGDPSTAGKVVHWFTPGGQYQQIIAPVIYDPYDQNRAPNAGEILESPFLYKRVMGLDDPNIIPRDLGPGIYGPAESAYYNVGDSSMVEPGVVSEDFMWRDCRNWDETNLDPGSSMNRDCVDGRLTLEHFDTAYLESLDRNTALGLGWLTWAAVENAIRDRANPNWAIGGRGLEDVTPEEMAAYCNANPSRCGSTPDRPGYGSDATEYMWARGGAQFQCEVDPASGIFTSCEPISVNPGTNIDREEIVWVNDYYEWVYEEVFPQLANGIYNATSALHHAQVEFEQTQRDALNQLNGVAYSVEPRFRAGENLDQYFRDMTVAEYERGGLIRNDAGEIEVVDPYKLRHLSAFHSDSNWNSIFSRGEEEMNILFEAELEEIIEDGERKLISVEARHYSESPIYFDADGFKEYSSDLSLLSENRAVNHRDLVKLIDEIRATELQMDPTSYLGLYLGSRIFRPQYMTKEKGVFFGIEGGRSYLKETQSEFFDGFGRPDFRGETNFFFGETNFFLLDGANFSVFEVKDEYGHWIPEPYRGRGFRVSYGDEPELL